MPTEVGKGCIPYRQLGRTGEKVSIIGMGGAHIGRGPTEQEAIQLIRSGIDRGINFMDNSWDYNNGDSEVRMGKALKDGYRQKVFLMTKLDGRTKEEATRQLDQSLQRLQTDHVDLIQHHEVIRFEDPDRIFAEGGAQEAVLEAKKAGKVRYIGFTGHKDPHVHLDMLQKAAEHGLLFDTVQMPLNVMDAHFRSFTHMVLPELVKQQIGVLGMKSMGSGVISEERSGHTRGVSALRNRCRKLSRFETGWKKAFRTSPQHTFGVRARTPREPPSRVAGGLSARVNDSFGGLLPPMGGGILRPLCAASWFPCSPCFCCSPVPLRLRTLAPAKQNNLWPR